MSESTSEKLKKEYIVTGQIHVDKPLTNISVAYRNEEYIADKVFPTVNVKKSSDKYFVFNKDGRIPETLRANRAAAREHTFKMSTQSYLLEDHALKDYISKRDMDNYDLPDLRTDVVEDLKDKILLRREKNVADFFNTTALASAKWSQGVSLASTAQWSANTTVSNPINVTDTALSTVLTGAYRKANTAIMPYEVKLAYRRHVSILDRIKYTSKTVDDNMIASLIDVQNLMVPSAQYESTLEGASTTTHSALWGKNTWIGYVAPRASMRNPSAGYTFRKENSNVRRWWNDERKSEAIEVGEDYIPKVVSSLSGYLIVASIG